MAKPKRKHRDPPRMVRRTYADSRFEFLLPGSDVGVQASIVRRRLLGRREGRSRCARSAVCPVSAS